MSEEFEKIIAEWKRRRSSAAITMHCDGGFNGDESSIGVAVHLWPDVEENPKEYLCVILISERVETDSSLGAELAALWKAMQYLTGLLRDWLPETFKNAREWELRNSSGDSLESTDIHGDDDGGSMSSHEKAHKWLRTL